MTNPKALEVRARAWAVWREGDAAPTMGGDLAEAPALPAGLRRRVTPVGRRALEVAWAVLAGRGGKQPQQPRIILSSRHGEYARTTELLRTLAESGEVSPAEFSLAVHHGLAGLLSIATGNRAGHTAVAAGSDSFGAALLEAFATLAEGEGNVLLMYFDEALPESYAAVGGDDAPALALALLLAAGDDGLRIGLDESDAVRLAGRLVRAA